MQLANRIVCTCVAFPHCGLACAFSDFQLDQRNLHILHICVLSPQCEWSYGSSSVLIDQMTYHILSKCGSSLHFGRACAFSESQPHQMTCCIGHNCMLFLCCEWLCASTDLLLDWMIERLCILPPLLASVCLSILICFAQIRNIQHRGVWQTRSSIL